MVPWKTHFSRTGKVPQTNKDKIDLQSTKRKLSHFGDVKKEKADNRKIRQNGYSSFWRAFNQGLHLTIGSTEGKVTTLAIEFILLSSLLTTPMQDIFLSIDFSDWGNDFGWTERKSSHLAISFVCIFSFADSPNGKRSFLFSHFLLWSLPQSVSDGPGDHLVEELVGFLLDFVQFSEGKKEVQCPPVITNLL